MAPARVLSSNKYILPLYRHRTGFTPRYMHVRGGEDIFYGIIEYSARNNGHNAATWRLRASADTISAQRREPARRQTLWHCCTTIVGGILIICEYDLYICTNAEGIVEVKRAHARHGFVVDFDGLHIRRRASWDLLRDRLMS